MVNICGITFKITECKRLPQNYTKASGAFPFSRSEASLVVVVRLALLALSVILAFAQAVVENANNTSPIGLKIRFIECYDDAGKMGMRPKPQPVGNYLLCQ